VPARRLQNPDPRWHLWTVDIPLLSGLECLGLVTPRNPRLAVPNLGKAEPAGNASNVHLAQELLGKSAGGDSPADVILPDVSFPAVSVPEVRPGGTACEEWTSPPIAEAEMVVVFRLGLGSCLVHFVCSTVSISGIDYYRHHEVFRSLRVYSIYGFCIGFILFIVLWHIAHPVFLQLLACKEPPCEDVEAE